MRRYPWTIAFIILFLAMCAGFLRTESLANQRDHDLADRREENLARDQQFCTAIPAVAVSSAQALVNVLLLDGTRRGVTEAQLENTRKLGLLFTSEARRLALSNLPECKKILNTPRKE